MDREAIIKHLKVLNPLGTDEFPDESLSEVADEILALQTPKERAAEEMFEALELAQEILFLLHAETRAYRKVNAVLAKAGGTQPSAKEGS